MWHCVEERQGGEFGRIRRKIIFDQVTVDRQDGQLPRTGDFVTFREGPATKSFMVGKFNLNDFIRNSQIDLLFKKKIQKFLNSFQRNISFQFHHAHLERQRDNFHPNKYRGRRPTFL